jgi:hypothetical protein
MGAGRSADINPLMPKVGDRIGDRYEIVRLLGEGGFSRVFEAKDEKAGGQVAIKVLDAELSHSARFARRFKQEIRFARELRHPNTIKVWDVGTTDEGLLFAVMEYAEGETLGRVLDREGSISVERTARIAEQILKGLAEAHARGIIHRDLKPANIFLCDVPGEEDFVKILDFGVAKSLAEDLSLVKTQTGQIMGTLGYAAPEALLGDPVSPASDLYAVGLMIAEMVTGRRAVRGDSAADVLKRQMAMTPESLSIVPEPGTLGEVVQRAISIRPESRYADAKEMLEALRGSRKTDILVAPAGDVITADWPRLALVETAEVAVATRAERPSAEEEAGGRAEQEAGEEPEDEADDRAAAARRWGGGWLVPWKVALVLLLVAAIPVGIAVLGDGRRGDSPSLEALASPLAEGDDPPIKTVVWAAPAEPVVWTPKRFFPLPPLPGESAETLSWDWLAAVGEEDVDPLALLQGEMPPPDAALGPEPEPIPQDLLEESVQAHTDALEMLLHGLTAGQIASERRDTSQEQLIDLYETVLTQLTEAHLCAAAARRLDHAFDNLEWLGPDGEQRLAALEEQVERCEARRPSGRVPWDSRLFVLRVGRAGQLYEQARALGPADLAAREALLTQSLRDYEVAREMLLTTLDREGLEPDHATDIEATLRWLDARIVAVLCALNHCGAAAVHLHEALGSEEPPELTDTDSTRSWLRDAGTDLLACTARTLVGEGPFDWAAFRELLSLGARLYTEWERAVESQAESRPELAVFAAQVTITSQPSDADIYFEGERIGNTPFEGELASEQGVIVVTLRRRDHRRRRLRIDLRGDETEYHVTLEPVSPFGAVERIGEGR